MSSESRTFQSRHKERRKLQLPPRSLSVPIDRLVDDLEELLDRAEPLIDFLEARIPNDGRPRELTVRKMLLWSMILMRTRQRLCISDFDDLVLSVDPEMRRRLGVIRGDGSPFTAKQLWRLFHTVVESIDPTGTAHALYAARQPTFTDEEHDERLAALQRVCDRIIEASIPSWLTHDSGDYATDGTTKWAFSRPRYRGLERAAGNDKGATLAMADVIDDDTDLGTAGFAATDHPEKDRAAALGKYDTDARYLGRRGSKAVYGYMLHTIVRVAPDQPILIERARTTPVTADPAKSVLPVLASLTHDRAADQVLTERVAHGEARILGNITADCGYSQAAGGMWFLAVRALGGNPISRLHSTNQAGLHHRHPDVMFCDGDPICDCIPDELVAIRYPRPGAPEAEHHAYQQAVETRARQFWYRPNGKPRRDGSRQFLAPHHHSDRPGGTGGCEHCTDSAGNPAIDPDTGLPRRRCCTKGSYVFTAEQIALHQEPRYGTPAWRDLNVLRNRVEAGNSILKSTHVVRWGKHDSHHYRGLAFESIIAAMAIAIVNLDQLEQWQIEQTATPPNRGGRPSNPGLDRYLPVPLAAASTGNHPAHGPP